MVELGHFDESNWRRSTFFGTDSVRAILTKWEFTEDGAKICVFDEFTNATIRGGKGTLSIAESPPHREIIWKLTWLTEDEQTQFEFYIGDRLDETGNSELTREEVIRLADQASGVVR